MQPPQVVDNAEWPQSDIAYNSWSSLSQI